ncbi:MAG: hypothetical protein RJS98_04325 [Rhodospirillaceae bacterium]
MFQPDTKTAADLMAEVAKAAEAQKAKKADGPPIMMRSVVANENRPLPSQALKIPTYDAPAARNIAWEDDDYFYVVQD